MKWIAIALLLSTAPPWYPKKMAGIVLEGFPQQPTEVWIVTNGDDMHFRRMDPKEVVNIDDKFVESASLRLRGHRTDCRKVPPEQARDKVARFVFTWNDRRAVDAQVIVDPDTLRIPYQRRLSGFSSPENDCHESGEIFENHTIYDVLQSRETVSLAFRNGSAATEFEVQDLLQPGVKAKALSAKEVAREIDKQRGKRGPLPNAREIDEKALSTLTSLKVTAVPPK